MKLFDLKPPPDVLVALTHTAMRPIDALCELLDNAIDSFGSSSESLQGINEINIELPTMTELQRGEGAIRVTDNGPGMTAADSEKALTAGYSSQKSYGRLGMFGMGLNIAAGKFVRKTRLVTATKTSEKVVVVDVDLDKLIEQRNFQVQPFEEPKGKYFRDHESGTIIELSGWWPQGSPNSDNPLKLIRQGPGKIREKLERRYATLLRPDSHTPFKMMVRGEECVPFEHCVWEDHRFVKRGSSKYHAIQRFDEVLQTQARCMECGGLADNGICPMDSSHPVTSVEEQIRGWVGVQRYDDLSHFGIDLIRNGRAIRVLEKDAFFTFESDSGESIKDYPIDSIYGRIVGEVHLNHIRVDFAKQDFDRSTPEWQRAIEFLRGASSLQTRRPGSSENDSPIMKIFKGYRRVRKIGLGDMYMGERKFGDNEPKRISREIERKFLEKFNNKEPGYYDDAEWWAKVEAASQDSDSFEQCPECEFQNSTATEICQGCGYLLKFKVCIGCKEKIPQSAPKCEHCGKLQIPEGPWECGVCGFNNSPDINECRQCGKPKGSINAFSPDVLLDNSWKDEHLSIKSVEIDLLNGGKSTKFNLETRIATLHDGSLHLPIIVHPRIPERKLQIFIDKNHPLFLSLQLQPEHAVSAEVAAFIRSESMPAMSNAQNRQQNLTMLQGRVLEKYWKNELSDDPEQVQRDMYSLLEDIRTRIVDNMKDIAEDVFNGMSTLEVNDMVKNMQESGANISEMGKFKEEGTFLFHVPPKTVISIFRSHPEKFFDKQVWNPPWNIPGLPDESVKVAQQQIKETYLNCLEDGISFLRYRSPPVIVIRRARLSIEFLQENIAD